jgi:hypothetical protein
MIVCDQQQVPVRLVPVRANRIGENLRPDRISFNKSGSERY